MNLRRVIVIIYYRKCRKLQKINYSNKLAKVVIDDDSDYSLEDLFDIVKSKVSWAEQWVAELTSSSSLSAMEQANYKQFTQLLLSSFYTTGVQGRPFAIEKMTLEAGIVLMNDGVAFSTEFKTHAKYGYQPIMASKVTGRLLKLYLCHVRPIILNTHRQSVDHNQLWLNYNGKPLQKLGKEVSSFFKIHGGIHVNTNDIRKLVETTSDTLQARGIITEEERLAVHNVNGHSSQTTRDYYIRKDRTEDAKLANNVFRQIIDNSDNSDADDNDDIPANFEPEIDVFASNFVIQPVDDWGTAHPDYGTDGQRAKWTDLEVETIGNWCAKQIRETPAIRPQIMRHCHEYFTTNGKPAVQHIFHPIHIRDNTTLRNGYRIAQQRKEFAILNAPACKNKYIKK
jgi:hypothetical protein